MYLLLVTKPFPIRAQTIGLSISPPVTEARLTPGQEIAVKYVVKNEGPAGFFILNLHPFTAQDDQGVPALHRSLSEFDPADYLRWFSFTNPKISPGGRFYLNAGAEKEIAFTIKPTLNSPEGDYYFTLTLEQEIKKDYSANAALLKTKVGSHLLISLIWDEKVKPLVEIKRFGVPKLVDSLFLPVISLQLTNNGKFFIKPIGTLTLESILGKNRKLPLAPLNVLAGSSRTIICQANHSLTPCKLSGLFLGPYRVTLSFNTDLGKTTYEATSYLFAFPFVLTLGLTLTILFGRMMVKKYLSRKTANK